MRRIALRLLRVLHGIVDDGHQLRASAKLVHGAALDQRLNHALVEQAQIDFFAELEDRGEPAQFFARRDDGLDGIVADILHRGQAEADRLAMRREVRVAHVDVGRFNRNAHLAAFVDVLHHVIGADGN